MQSNPSKRRKLERRTRYHKGKRRKLRTRILSAWLVGALPLTVAAAETPSPQGDSKGAAQVGGVSTIDYVSLRAGSLGAPLRFGHVFPGTERVILNGRILTAGNDYAMDYETGVVYLKLAQRTGDQLTVAYRYDPQGKAGTGTSFQGVNSFGLSLAPGLGLVGGLGVTERAADGSVLSSNVFGWNNTLNFGGKSSMSGLFLYSDRQKTANSAGLSLDMNAAPGQAGTEQGASQFLLQSFRTSLLGGTASYDIQDISKNFGAASQVRAAGYSDADVARLMKERGLKRQGVSFSGLKFGDSTVGLSMKSVGQDGQGIDWRNLSYQQGGLSMSMNSQKVGSGFTRFGDLAEADRDQLAREAGMSRDGFALGFANKASKFSFSSTSIDDDKADSGIVRREAHFDTSKFGFSYGEQEVDKDFARIGSLTGDEQARYGREIGVKRQWSGLTAALGGTAAGKFAFNQLDLKSSSGMFAMTDASYQSKTWNLDHVRMGGSGTVPTGSLQDAEANAFAKRASNFFGNPGLNDGHRLALLNSGNVTRDFTSLNGNLGKGSTFHADRLQFGEGDKGAVSTSVAITTSKIQASFKQQDLSKQFADSSRLLDFEQSRMGVVAGLQRSDAAFAALLPRGAKFSFGQTNAAVDGGKLDRTTLAYSAKGLEVNAAQRNVGQGFGVAGSLTDPENSLLAQFQGFQERDLGMKFNGVKGLNVEAFVQDATNDTTDEKRSVANYSMNWQVDGRTNLSLVSQKYTSNDPLTTLFAQSLERMALQRNLGRFGNLTLVDERTNYDGKNNTTPDYHKQFLAYETKIDSRTSVRTEQTRTSYDDGNKEDISANTVSTSITPRVGVSLTDIKIDRKGDDNDEQKTNYGFWYDLGKGLRLSYGFAQQLAGQTNGTTNYAWSLGTGGTLNPGQQTNVGQANVGGILLGGGYSEANIPAADASHVQSFANFGLSTAKPLSYAGFSDVKFSFGLDTAADLTQYLRENQAGSLSGRFGKNTFAFGYRGQLAATDEQAIDRSVTLGTDPDPRKPLVLNGTVKLRTLPEDKEYTSRNFSVTARPLPGIELVNQVQTNLEQPDASVLLGSRLMADRSNAWRLNFKGNGDTSFGASWEQKSNDDTAAWATTSGVNLTMFQKSGSPLKLFYGLEEVQGNLPHRMTTRYSFQFDQRPGPNQLFSLFVGNVDYRYSIADGMGRDNWTMRLNYQIRF